MTVSGVMTRTPLAVQAPLNMSSTIFLMKKESLLFLFYNVFANGRVFFIKKAME